MAEESLKIGEVADRCGVSRGTLRYWEKEGVLPEPPREESSRYRVYPPDLVRRVRAVKRAKELGFTLEEIARLFEGRDRGETCEQLGRIARERVATLRDEIERLQKKVEGLEALADVCPGDLPASECPVVDVLVES